MKRLLTIFLLVCVLLGFSCQIPGKQAAAQTSGENNVGVFKAYEVAPGASLTLPIEVKGVQELYGIDLEMKFDPALLQIVDADEQTPGVQVALGTFLDAGLLLFNEADNSTGTLRFAMSQMNPSEAKSGDGVLLVVTFKGVKEGASDLKVTKLDMSTREGEAIAGIAADSQVNVKAGAGGQPVVNLPTQSMGGVITVPTSMPMAQAQPTAMPQPSATSAQAVAQIVQPTVIQGQTSPTAQSANPTVMPTTKVDRESDATTNQAETTQKSSQGLETLLPWMIGLGILLILVAGGLYFGTQKKPTKPTEEVDE